MPKKKLWIPHVHVMIFGLLLLTAAASFVVPAGSYERDADQRILPGTYAPLEEAEAGQRPTGWHLFFAVFTAPLKGVKAASSVIAFILFIGGAFKVIERTGAFDAAIVGTVSKLGHRKWLIIPLTMVLFSIGGAVFGMGEEIIPFVLLLVPLVHALGYHPILAVAIPLVGSQVGFAGAMINPFTVGIAQGIAELPPLSGWQYRTVIWVLVTALGIGYVASKARALQVADGDDGDDASADQRESKPLLADGPIQGRHMAVLALLAAGILVILWGVHRFEWYVIEIGAIFVIVGIAAGIVGRLPANDIAESFVDGARDLVGAAMVIGAARGIVVLAQDLQILDSILHGVAGGLAGMPAALALNLMFLFQTCLNFLIPSGSGQAALTMPIMAPLAELLGLTRQMAVLAFQLGDGFSNLIVPTSAVLMGSLEAGKISYEEWFGFAWKLQLWLMAFAAVALCGAVAIGYGP